MNPEPREDANHDGTMWRHVRSFSSAAMLYHRNTIMAPPAPSRLALLGAITVCVLPCTAQWEDSTAGCTPIDACVPCEPAQKNEWFCVATGYIHTLSCPGTAGGPNTTKVGSCNTPGDGVGTFLTFEVLMLLIFGASITVANQRKSRLLSIQHHRIAQYLHT